MTLLFCQIQTKHLLILTIMASKPQPTFGALWPRTLTTMTAPTFPACLRHSASASTSTSTSVSASAPTPAAASAPAPAHVCTLFQSLSFWIDVLLQRRRGVNLSLLTSVDNIMVIGLPTLIRDWVSGNGAWACHLWVALYMITAAHWNRVV